MSTAKTPSTSGASIGSASTGSGAARAANVSARPGPSESTVNVGSLTALQSLHLKELNQPTRCSEGGTHAVLQRDRSALDRARADDPHAAGGLLLRHPLGAAFQAPWFRDSSWHQTRSALDTGRARRRHRWQERDRTARSARARRRRRGRTSASPAAACRTPCPSKARRGGRNPETLRVRP